MDFEPNLPDQPPKGTLSEEYSHELWEWHDNFVSSGNNEDAEHKSGSQQSAPTLAANPTVIHKAIKLPDTSPQGQLSAALAYFYNQFASQENKKAKKQYDQQVALKEKVAGYCDALQFSKDTWRWQGFFYAEMLRQAAWLQSLADQYAAAGDLATANMLRNNPLQQAINAMPEFAHIAANPPYADAGEHVLGEFSVPNEAPPTPALPWDEPKSGDPSVIEAAPPVVKPAPMPHWDLFNDPILKAWNQTHAMVCGDLAHTKIPEPKVMPKLPVAAFVALAALILLLLCGVTGAAVISGRGTPNESRQVEQSLGIRPDSTATFTPIPARAVTDTPTPTTAVGGQPILPQGSTVTPQVSLCADRGGTSFYGEVCICPGIIDQVTICGDGTKFDNPTTTECVPSETCTNTGSPVDPQQPVCACGQHGAPTIYDLGCSDGTIQLCNEDICGCKP